MTLLIAAGELADVLARENASLRALAFGRTSGFAAEKEQAIARFNAALRAAPRGGLPHALATRIAALAQENKRLLERALYVQGEVIACIARAAPRARPGGRSYGRTGSLTADRRAAPIAIAAHI